MRQIIIAFATIATIAGLTSCSKTPKIQVRTTDTHLKMVAKNPDGISLIKGDTVHLYTSSLVALDWEVRNDGRMDSIFTYSGNHCMAIVL